MKDFTFLTEEQCFGDDKLDILEKRGTKAAITDFSILLGACVSDYHIYNDSSLKGRTGYYWTKSDDEDNDACVVDNNGDMNSFCIEFRHIGARPALSFSEISSIPTNGEGGKRARDGIFEVEYGYYPQKAVAEDLAEPLEKRFDHILDMEPKVGEWITEYAIPQKIHPAVIGYMLSRYNNSGKSEEIEDIGYFYEEPEVGEEHLDRNGCKGRTNDPRGWTSISNTLYNFERNLEQGKYEGKDVEDIIQRSIGTKLREEWAAEFFDFYNLPTLTPEEVVKGMGEGYTQADLPRDISERFAYMTALITADESQVEACREFIRKYCDPEYLEVYDIYWAGNDERRQEKISELQEMNLALHRSKETKSFAQDGASRYTRLGQMYSAYLERDSKEIRSEENERE